MFKKILLIFSQDKSEALSDEMKELGTVLEAATNTKGTPGGAIVEGAYGVYK